MDSAWQVHRRYRRFFAWTAMLAALLLLGLFALEILFPPDAMPPNPASPGGTKSSGFDLRDLQLLVTISALIVAVASFAGFGIAALLEWLDKRRERKEVTQHWAGGKGRAAEPGNERLRALRAVASSLKETPDRKA
ncbi:hypothetical protein [Variovorax guangxiensis]|uniref:hypothetical protein n=1 Tax=Variovorax guangxiensis TaxID=1775474 RepID=UPI002862FA1C|nr:hypothetical protein [Variovorax guangxiensis]MDR6861342.1 quinol-cytochrome oxidoreductase complex cytochrome b subunit [Variovorax guangxiensis]